MGLFGSMLNNSKAWLLILVGPFFCLLPDISIKIYNNWWGRSPIDWILKEIDDSKTIRAQVNKDIEARRKMAREEAKKRRLEARKALGFDYLDEEEEERIAEQEAQGIIDISQSEKKLLDHDGNANEGVTPFKPNGYGDEYYDNEAYGGEYGDEYGEEMPTKSAKYKKSATKKKKKTVNLPADGPEIDDKGTVKASVKKSVTKKSTISPKKKKQPT